jgi:inner membrane protein
VDNVTHAFVGAAIAECALPKAASAGTRAVFMCVGIVAANVPDVDLLYTGIVEEPLGYLLHHRGHSHTLPGLAALGGVIWAGLQLWPKARQALSGSASRAMWLIAAALVSHLLMDTANGYGTHPFYPLSSRWVYGDAVFVLEPWLWAMLGATIAMNAGRWLWRVLVPLLTLFLVGTLVYLGLLPVSVMIAMLAAIGIAAIVVRSWEPRRRAWFALVATAVIFVGMSGVSRLVKAEARRAASHVDVGEVVDIVADANPGVPWCWAVLTLQKATEGSHDVLIARRGTVSLFPNVWPAPSCVSAQLSAGRWSTGDPPSQSIVWHRRWQERLDYLRELRNDNCRVRAWLQFGRAPYLADGVIRDLRFENPIGQNFTPMNIDNGSRACPSYLSDWEPPRRDVLEPQRDF